MSGAQVANIAFATKTQDQRLIFSQKQNHLDHISNTVISFGCLCVWRGGGVTSTLGLLNLNLS